MKRLYSWHMSAILRMIIRPDVRYSRNTFRLSGEDLIHQVFQFVEGILLHQALPNRILGAVCLSLYQSVGISSLNNRARYNSKRTGTAGASTRPFLTFDSVSVSST